MYLRTNSANLTRSLVRISGEFVPLIRFLMLKFPLCVVCLDINRPHLQLLEKNPWELFLYSFDLFNKVSRVSNVWPITLHLNENQETLMLFCWSSAIGDYGFSRQVHYNDAYEFCVIDIICLDLLFSWNHRKSIWVLSP